MVIAVSWQAAMNCPKILLVGIGNGVCVGGRIVEIMTLRPRIQDAPPQPFIQFDMCFYWSELDQTCCHGNQKKQ